MEVMISRVYGGTGWRLLWGPFQGPEQCDSEEPALPHYNQHCGKCDSPSLGIIGSGGVGGGSTKGFCQG